VILLVSVAAAIAIALLRGGRFSRLAALKLRWAWLALLALVPQMVIVYVPALWEYPLWGLRLALLVASYVLLIGVVLANRRLPGVIIIGLGLLLNLAPMVANHGFMPVTSTALEQAGLSHLAVSEESGARVLSAKDMLLAREDTNLWALSDIMVLPPPVRSVCSIGDAVLVLGVFIFFQRAMRPVRVASHPVAEDPPSRCGELS
jgi:hypothetical protein